MSHHGNELNEQMRKLVAERSKALSEKMERIFGEYPNGRLNKDDAGALAVAIGHENGAVTIQFPKPVAWIGFTPEQAVDIANTLLKHAREVGFSQTVTVNL